MFRCMSCDCGKVSVPYNKYRGCVQQLNRRQGQANLHNRMALPHATVDCRKQQTSRSPWPPHGLPLQAHTRTWDETHVSLRRPALNARRFTLVSGSACPPPSASIRQQTRRERGPGDSDRNKNSDPALAWESHNGENGKLGTILGGREQKGERLGVARSTGSFWWPHPSLPHSHSRQHTLSFGLWTGSGMG